MDFIENLNESWQLRFEEISELGNPCFILQDIDNDIWHRFFPEDLQIFQEFLKFIKDFHQSYTIKRSVNESYNLEYHIDHNIVSDKYVVVLEDIDQGNIYNFYPEDILKIEKFLNRLVDFKVIK